MSIVVFVVDSSVFPVLAAFTIVGCSIVALLPAIPPASPGTSLDVLIIFVAVALAVLLPLPPADLVTAASDIELFGKLAIVWSLLTFVEGIKDVGVGVGVGVGVVVVEVVVVVISLKVAPAMDTIGVSGMMAAAIDAVTDRRVLPLISLFIFLHQKGEKGQQMPLI